jgi:hypothetical protein
MDVVENRPSIQRVLRLVAVAALSSACADPPSSTSPLAARGAPSSSPTAVASAAPGQASPASAAASHDGAATPVPPGACAPPDCRLFDKPEDALAEVVKTRPLVLGIGETHAQKGSEAVKSTTSRFTEQLLPMLAGHSTDLLLELWVADGSCGKKEAQVAKEQKKVTEKQADTNQNEFVTLANRSKSLGIKPHVLRPTCEEYDRVVKAGPDGIDTMLTMIARLTAKMAKDMLRAPGATPPKMLLIYGGAMHNDVAPRKGREAWSFGPELAEHTKGKYVELDLIVREYIKDNDSWRSMPWYARFDRSKHEDKAVLFQTSPGSYTLIFAKSR